MRSEVPETSTGRTAARRPASRSLRRAVAGAAAIAVGAMGLAACGGGSSSTSNSANVNSAAKSLGTVVAGKLPPVGTPTHGGTLTGAQLTGQTPTYLFAITPGANSSTAGAQLIAQLWMPLYYGPNGAKPEVDYNLSAASGAPVESNGGKTYTIHLKSGLKWSNGQPVDSDDILFFYDLLKAALKENPANWGQYSPGQFPDNVKSISAPNATTVVMNLKKSYNPGYFLYNSLQDTNFGVYPLPANSWDIAAPNGPHLNWQIPANATKIYNYLNKEGAAVSSFGTNPLWKTVDGPYSLKSFSATNGSYVLIPNPTYGGTPKSYVSEVDINTYTSSTAELNALKSGSLDLGGLDAGTQLGAIPALKSLGDSVFGTPGFGWYGGIINWEDTTDDFNKIISQPYIRQALAELINQEAIVKGVYHGWAVQTSGPIPSAPDSPYAPPSASKPVYPYNPTEAAAILKSHGWKVVPNGQTTCEKAGTAANECGAGIPAGTPFKFVWANVPESTASTGVLESQAFSSEAKAAAGIDIELTTKTFNFLVSNYNDANPAAKQYTNDWAVNNYGGINFDYYPTQYGLLSPGAGFNMGNFNDPEANKLMLDSAYSTKPTAVQTEDEYLSKNYPVFWMPDEDQIAVVSKKVGGSNDAFLELGYQQTPLNLLYITK